MCTGNSPRLPVEKRLEEADRDPVSFTLMPNFVNQTWSSCKPREGATPNPHPPMHWTPQTFVKILPPSEFGAFSFPQPTLPTRTPLWDLHILHALSRPGCRGGARKRLQVCSHVKHIRRALGFSYWRQGRSRLPGVRDHGNDAACCTVLRTSCSRHH